MQSGQSDLESHLRGGHGSPSLPYPEPAVHKLPTGSENDQVQPSAPTSARSGWICGLNSSCWPYDLGTAIPRLCFTTVLQAFPSVYFSVSSSLYSEAKSHLGSKVEPGDISGGKWKTVSGTSAICVCLKSNYEQRCKSQCLSEKIKNKTKPEP